MKRILAILLTALMILSTCGTAMAAEPLSYYAYFCGEHQEGSYIEKYVEEALDLELDVRKVAHTDLEAVNLMVAQDMPECGWYALTWDFMNDQEMVRTIPIDMVREYAPSLAAYMDENPVLWALATDAEDPTQLRYLPSLAQTTTQLYRKCYFLRYDWIQALGIDLGINVEQVDERLYAGDKGLSMEKFIEVLDKFINNDPDGNGVADTVGYTYDYTQLLSAFGIIDEIMEVDGKATQWFTHPNMKKMLLKVQEMYAAGLIYPEIFTTEIAQEREMMNNGVTGVLVSSNPNTLNSWANTRPPRTILDDPTSTATLLMIPGIADETGKTPRTGYFSDLSVEYFFVRWDVTDEKLATILKFYEWTNWNKDLDVMATLWYGEQGVNWEWNEDKTRPVQLKALANGEEDAQIFCRDTQVGTCWEWVVCEPQMMVGKDYFLKPADGMWNKEQVLPYKQDVFNVTNAAVIQNEYKADWEMIYKAYFMDVIMGQKNVEADWDAYIAELNDVGYADYLAEIEKAPVVTELLAELAK